MKAETKMDTDKEEIKKMIREIAKEEIKKLLQGELFTARKLTDTPTDSLSVVNRQYVNLSGTSSSRPTGSILGQRYFDTTINRPIVWNGTSWIDGAGSVT